MCGAGRGGCAGGVRALVLERHAGGATDDKVRVVGAQVDVMEDALLTGLVDRQHVKGTAGEGDGERRARREGRGDQVGPPRRAADRRDVDLGDRKAGLVLDPEHPSLGDAVAAVVVIAEAVAAVVVVVAVVVAATSNRRDRAKRRHHASEKS